VHKADISLINNNEDFTYCIAKNWLTV